MLTPRNVVAAVCVAALVSLVAAVYDAAHPQYGSLGRTSYATSTDGHKALFDLLERLAVPVERNVAPTEQVLARSAALVLWAPDPVLTAREPARFRHVEQWVSEGGALVVAPLRPGKRPDCASCCAWGEEPVRPKSGLMEELGMRGWKLSTADLATSSGGHKPQDSDRTAETLLFEEEEPLRRLSLRVETSGSLESLGGICTRLALPAEGLAVLDIGPTATKPSGRIVAFADSGESVTVAARYNVGRGNITVVSDPVLFENQLLADDDNAVLAAHLLVPAAGRGSVIFDEFYHGLGVRGNPLWLFSFPAMALCAAFVLAATLLWAWRGFVELGPPAPAPAPSRRALGEYIDAMARFFCRGRSRAFLLRELRGGVLWMLRKRAGLPPGSETAEAVAAALARHDAGHAKRLLDAVHHADALLGRGGRIGATEFIKAAKELNACL